MVCPSRQLTAVPTVCPKLTRAGGKLGYDKVEWQAAPGASDRGQAVRLTYTSPAGEEVRASAGTCKCAKLHGEQYCLDLSPAEPSCAQEQ